MDTEKQEVEDSLEKVEEEEKIQDSDNTTEEAIIDEENLGEKDLLETPPISDEEVTQDFIQPAFGTTQIRSVSELQSAHTRLDYSGRIRADGEYQGLTSHRKPLEDREEMHQKNFGIAHKKPLLIHYENEQFSMEGQFILRENLYNKKYVFPSMNYYWHDAAIKTRESLSGLTLYIYAYDENGNTIKSTRDGKELYLKQDMSRSHAPNARGELAFHYSDVSLENRSSEVDVENFLNAKTMRLKIGGILHSTCNYMSLHYNHFVNSRNIHNAYEYTGEYGNDLVHYVQKGRVEKAAKFTRTPQSQLLFEKGNYYLQSDVGVLSTHADWMLVAANTPGQALEGEDCDCDWVRYYNLTDAYRNEIHAGKKEFEIDFQELLGNVTPERNHAYHVEYYLIDPNGIDMDKIEQFNWGTRSSEQAFNGVFPKTSIQETSLRSTHYFDLSLNILNSTLYRKNKYLEEEKEWTILQYIESDFLVEGDKKIQDIDGTMKDYNLKVRLFSESSYQKGDQDLREEACMLIDGKDIPLDVVEIPGEKLRYEHRFHLRKTLPSSCEGDAKEVVFDQDRDYYIRASLKRKVEEGEDVYLRSGYHDIEIEKRAKIYRRLITKAYEYEDVLIYIQDVDDEKEQFNIDEYIHYYSLRKEEGKPVAYMGYVAGVPEHHDPSEMNLVENEKLRESNEDFVENGDHYIVFYEINKWMFDNQRNNFLSFQFPFLEKDESGLYHAEVETDSKITNPYFVISNDQRENNAQSLYSVSVSMMPFKDEEGTIKDGFSLQLEMEIFGIRNWLFANMERGDASASTTVFMKSN